MDSQHFPEVTDEETVMRRSGYQSLEPVTRPTYWGVDLDLARRPGVPMEGTSPAPMPNARLDIEPMSAESAAPKHNRTNRPMPPVYGTVLPMRGVSGALRRFAATMPDHKPQFWLIKLFADRVESWGYHAKKYGIVALPFAGAFFLTRALRS